MTNKEIQRLSAPVVRAYLDMEDELLRLIGEQLGRDKRLSDTSKWRIRQLARAGEVNRQALAIIDSYAGGISAEVAEAVLAAAEGEVGVLDEAMLSLLSEKGRMTDEQMQMMQAFERQSRQDLNIENASIAHGYAEALEEDCNLVNTVMGYQTQSTFVSAVNQIYNEAERQRVLDEMNAGAMSVVSGNESLQEATRKTIKRIAEKGIPGFVDKAGREWSPEAYVKMDLRSTMGNTARAAQDARCDRYGISLIEVSSHMGARPKCAPYQGRIFSRDGTRGVTEDINGRQIEYIPLSETSYGEPDGLFGINCGHQQYPFIPGVSLQRYYPYDEEQNAERYRELQQQRAMERKIRSDKQECMMLQAAGDEEGLKEAAKKLRLDKDKYKDFNKAHGLGDHMENTQVFGYDKSKSMKTVWATRNKAASSSVLTSDDGYDKIYLDGESDKSLYNHGLNLFSKNSPLYADATSVEPERNRIDIYAHGAYDSKRTGLSQKIEIDVNGKIVQMTPEEFAKELIRRGYKGGDLRLVNCSLGRGENSFAERLSKVLPNADIKAPNDDVYYAPDEGTVFVGSPNMNTGDWRRFKNGEEIKN